jgi:hypothetical protein
LANYDTYHLLKQRLGVEDGIFGAEIRVFSSLCILISLKYLDNHPTGNFKVMKNSSIIAITTTKPIVFYSENIISDILIWVSHEIFVNIYLVLSMENKDTSLCILCLWIEIVLTSNCMKWTMKHYQRHRTKEWWNKIIRPHIRICSK